MNAAKIKVRWAWNVGPTLVRHGNADVNIKPINQLFPDVGLT